VTRLKVSGPQALQWSLRVTIAATASYVVGTLFFPGTQPLLAPLTAMLVVQVTPVSLLTAGRDRVLAVVAGVSLAVAFSAVMPLEWWSLGLLIFSAITIGQAMRLQYSLVEVAISGMLVLGVGSFVAEAAAWQRLAETLVGAAVGVAANLLFPPKVASADASRSIDGLADAISELLTRAADELAETTPDNQTVAAHASAWLDEARRITRDIPRIGAALMHAEQGRRLNVRAVGTPDVGPGLRQGLESLEHSAIAIRAMFRSVWDLSRDGTMLDEQDAGEVLSGLEQTFREMAAGLDAFGHLVREEADPATRMSADNVQQVREALIGLEEARSRHDALLVDAGSHGLLELHAAILSTVKRLLGELDLDARIRKQVRSLRARRPRPRGAGTPGDQPPMHEPPPDAETQLLPQPPRDSGDTRR
jgi:hypothetical protein